MTKCQAALALCLALCACYPTTNHPVGTTVGIRNDPMLAGTWKTLPQPGDKGHVSYVHVLTKGGGGYIAIAVPASGPASDSIIAAVSTARFGTFGFLNAKFAEADGRIEPGQPAGTMPLLYRFGHDGMLSVFVIDEDATKAAIRAHKIAGDAGKAGSDDSPVITADPRALDQFFQSPAGQALFLKPWFIMRKVE